MGSFQTLQSLSKSLFESSTEVQRLMDVNRLNREIAKKELAEGCQLMGKLDTSQQKTQVTKSVLHDLRRQIFTLEEEHIALHKEFISLQARCRQVVKEQRRNLVGTINRTRALSPTADGEMRLVASMPGDNSSAPKSFPTEPPDFVLLKSA